MIFYLLSTNVFINRYAYLKLLLMVKCQPSANTGTQMAYYAIGLKYDKNINV